MQRTLTIIAIVTVLAGAGIAAYFYFFTGAADIAVAPAGSTTLPVAGQGTPVTGATSTPSLSPGTPITVSARLVQISKGPVVPGEVVVDIKSSGTASTSAVSDVSVQYIERQSGNVYSYLTRTKTITRTSNRTVPGIQSASWLPDASFAFVRYLSGADFSTINTYTLPANGSGGFFLPQNLADIAITATNILTLSSGVNGSAASLARTDGSHSLEVFTTPLSSLRVSFAGKSQYLAFTKPSATLAGDAFLVDATGHFSRVAGPHNGLVGLSSPSGKFVLVSYILNSVMQMNLVNTITRETIALPVATIADKCVWGADDSVVYCGIPVNPSANFSYPDDWYQGAAHFSDRIWKIQISSRYAQLVLDFSKENQGPIDVEALAINPAGTVLVFINKNDSSLWAYSL